MSPPSARHEPLLSPLRPATRLPRRRRGALIGLTPLIDVVFILLIFFMLVTSFLDRRSIELSPPAQAAAGASMEGALLVEVRADGTLRLSAEAVSPAVLAARLRDLLGAEPDRRVLVKPAAGVSLQRTVAVLDRIVAAGAWDVRLTRDPER